MTETRLRRAVDAVHRHTTSRPKLALVLGSGLSDLADEAAQPVVIPSAKIPGYPGSTVAGHHGRLVFGELNGCDVVFVQGRLHMYEGHDLADVTFPIRLVHALGATHVLVTNAAGGIHPSFVPGTLMWITDDIDWVIGNPFSGDAAIRSKRSPYDAEWLQRADGLAQEAHVPVEHGTYLWTLGPSYETKAEIRAFRTLGADAVGMSTVPEVRVAAELGLHVLGLSTITNFAAGLGHETLDHGEVLEVGRAVRERLANLIRLVAGDVAGFDAL